MDDSQKGTYGDMNYYIEMHRDADFISETGEIDTGTSAAKPFFGLACPMREPSS